MSSIPNTHTGRVQRDGIGQRTAAQAAAIRHCEGFDPADTFEGTCTGAIILL